MGSNCVESWQEAGMIKEGQATCSMCRKRKTFRIKSISNFVPFWCLLNCLCRTVFLLCFFSKLVAGDEIA